MASETLWVVPRAPGFRAMEALSIVSILFSFGCLCASGASRDNQRQVEARQSLASSSRSEARVLSAPLSFEPNQGQAASTVEFLAHGSGYALFLAPGRVVLELERQQPASGDTLSMSLIGADANAHAAGLARQSGVVSYFIGNDPKNWRTGIPTYGKVEYAQIYPGVDLIFYGNQRQLEYDFVVAPEADPSRIAWRVDGARANVDRQGNLVLRAPNGPTRFQRPVVYQTDGDKKTNVEGDFAVAGNQVCFRLGDYDHSRALIIDPVLSYASYLGGSGSDRIGTATGPGIMQVGASQGLAVGSVYVTGTTFSTDFPTKNPYQSALPAKVQGVSPGQWPSAFVTKFSPDGSSLVYSTYLGGNGYDHGYAITVDSGGNAYVTGYTSSPNFPITSGAYQKVCSPTPNSVNGAANLAPTSCNGSSDASAFVTKLNATGTGLVYSTFLGGYSWAYATAIAVDSAGRAYIAGNEEIYCSTAYTFQGCFPTTTGAVIGGNATGGRSPQYAFAAVFDPTGAYLLYSTLFGDLNAVCNSGCGGTYGTGVAVDAKGSFYLIGETQAGKLPTTVGVIQPSSGPLTGAELEPWRGFVAKFNPIASASGVSLVYATYLGGKATNTDDYISGITTDDASDAYIVGYTNSKDFPVTSGAYQTICGINGQTCAAAHVTKLNPLGTSILWSTYVGGGKADGSDNFFFTGPIQLDGNGNIYIIGQTGAGTGFPMVNPVEPTPAGGNAQVLIAELDPTGTQVLFSTTIGSNGLQTAYPGGLAVDSAGDIYLAGNHAGPGLITTPGAFQSTASNSLCCYHGFVAKIAPTPLPFLQSGTLAHGATYMAGGLVPGSWAQVKGTNLSATARIWAASDFTGLGNNLPTNLDGTQVMVNNLAAAVYYVSPTQVSFQVPAGITGTASVRVIVNGVTSNSVSAAAATNALGIFPVMMGGINYPAAIFLDGKVAADPANGPGFRNAVPGDTLQLYATGLAPSPAGTVVSTTLVSGVTVTIGNITIPALAALVAVGEFQINFTVPQDFASMAQGVYPLAISINGVTSPASMNSAPPGPVVIPIQH